MNVSDELNDITKLELNRDMTTEEVSVILSDAGKLAWLAIGSSPLSAFLASHALQRNRSQIPQLVLLRDTRNKLQAICSGDWTSLK